MMRYIRTLWRWYHTRRFLRLVRALNKYVGGGPFEIAVDSETDNVTGMVLGSCIEQDEKE